MARRFKKTIVNRPKSEIRDRVVLRDCGSSGWRYLTFGFGMQYADHIAQAGKTTAERAKMYENREGYRVEIFTGE